MAAGEQELGSSFANQTFATGEAFGSELDGPTLSRPQIAAIQSEKTVRDSEWDCSDAHRSNRDLEAGSRVGAGFVDLAVQRVCPGHETPSRLGQHHSARPRSNGGLWCIAPTPGFVG